MLLGSVVKIRRVGGDLVIALFEFAGNLVPTTFDLLDLRLFVINFSLDLNGLILKLVKRNFDEIFLFA